MKSLLIDRSNVLFNFKMYLLILGAEVELNRRLSYVGYFPALAKEGL